MLDESKINHVTAEPGYHEWLAVIRDEKGSILDTVSLGDLMVDYCDQIYNNGHPDIKDYAPDIIYHQAEDLVSAVDEQREEDGLYTLKDVLNEKQMTSLVEQIADVYYSGWQLVLNVQNKNVLS